MIFNLEVERTYVHKGVVTVEAETIEEARLLAFSKIDDTELPISSAIEDQDSVDGYSYSDVQSQRLKLLDVVTLKGNDRRYKYFVIGFQKEETKQLDSDDKILLYPAFNYVAGPTPIRRDLIATISNVYESESKTEENYFCDVEFDKIKKYIKDSLLMSLSLYNMVDIDEFVQFFINKTTEKAKGE